MRKYRNITKKPGELVIFGLADDVLSFTERNAFYNEIKDKEEGFHAVKNYVIYKFDENRDYTFIDLDGNIVFEHKARMNYHNFMILGSFSPEALNIRDKAKKTFEIAFNDDEEFSISGINKIANNFYAVKTGKSKKDMILEYDFVSRYLKKYNQEVAHISVHKTKGCCYSLDFQVISHPMALVVNM